MELACLLDLSCLSFTHRSVVGNLLHSTQTGPADTKMHKEFANRFFCSVSDLKSLICQIISWQPVAPVTLYCLWERGDFGSTGRGSCLWSIQDMRQDSTPPVCTTLAPLEEKLRRLCKIFWVKPRQCKCFCLKQKKNWSTFPFKKQRTWNQKDHPQENWLNWIRNKKYRANKPELSVTVFPQTTTGGGSQLQCSLVLSRWTRAEGCQKIRTKEQWQHSKKHSQSTCDGGWLNSSRENVLTVGRGCKHHALFHFDPLVGTTVAVEQDRTEMEKWLKRFFAIMLLLFTPLISKRSYCLFPVWPAPSPSIEHRTARYLGINLI